MNIFFRLVIMYLIIHNDVSYAITDKYFQFFSFNYDLGVKIGFIEYRLILLPRFTILYPTIFLKFQFLMLADIISCDIFVFLLL